MGKVRKRLEHGIVLLGYLWGPRLMTTVRIRVAQLRNPRAKISFGPGCKVGPRYSIDAPWGGTFTVGSDTELRRDFRAELAGPDTRIEIGSGCRITYSV